MTIAQEYRRFSVGFVDLATQQMELSGKTGRLIIAEAWLDLTEQTTQSGCKASEVREAVERPLIAAHVIRRRYDD